MCKISLTGLYVLVTGERPDFIMFTSLINGYCLVGKTEKTFRVLDAMVSVGVEPNVITCGTIMAVVKMEGSTMG